MTGLAATTTVSAAAAATATNVAATFALLAATPSPGDEPGSLRPPMLYLFLLGSLLAVLIGSIAVIAIARGLRRSMSAPKRQPLATIDANPWVEAGKRLQVQPQENPVQKSAEGFPDDADPDGDEDSGDGHDAGLDDDKKER